MNTKRLNTPLLAGSQVVLLCGVLLQVVSPSAAADPASGTGQFQPLQLAQQKYGPSKWPGEDAGQSANQGMMPPGMGPGGWGMMPGPMAPGGQRTMPPGMGSADQGMKKPGTGPGTQSPMSQSMMGPGMGPPTQGMMAGSMGGSPMAMLGAIGTLDLSDEQRSKYDAIHQDLNTRMREITDRMKAESEKLRKLQEEQIRIGRTLNDLRGHMYQATMDAANRAEELLTDEQHQTLLNQGNHFMMMQPPGPPSAGAQAGKTEARHE